jgi:hypothetical protein
MSPSSTKSRDFEAGFDDFTFLPEGDRRIVTLLFS